MNTYTASYTGYVYIWYDTIAKFYYVGGHHGRVEDSYVCSNKPMKRAYKLRPKTFKFRVLEYINNGKLELRQAEQRWLDLIQDHELMISENVKHGTCRYYNVKKTSAGGSHKGHKKNRTKPAWNKGLKGYQAAWNKGMKNDNQIVTAKPPGPVRSPRVVKTCMTCDATWEALPSSKKRYCSVICSPKLGGGWNKGQKLDYCEKLSQAKLGRKRVYLEDGTWFMK